MYLRRRNEGLQLEGFAEKEGRSTVSYRPCSAYYADCGQCQWRRERVGRSLDIGNEVCRYNWHSAGSMGWPFPMLNINIFFKQKKYGSNFSKQHSKTIMVRNYKNADCSLKINFVSFIIIFGTLSVPVASPVCREPTDSAGMKTTHRLVTASACLR